MKRNLLVIVLLALLLPLAPSPAQQDSSTAAAEREQAEERHRTLTKRLAGLEESIAAFQKNVTALRDEVRRLKDELDRSKSKNETSATQESIKYLAEKIEEVDKKRIADNERTVKHIDKKIDDMRKFVLESLAGPRGGTPTPPPSGATVPNKGNNSGAPPKTNPDGKQTGWTYKIKDKDTLAVIVAALRKQGINVTQKQIEQANEGVNWNKLRIGQEIFIPAPAQ
jgi:septal ring factor EnvC (AmiA/AmiB activator)